MDTPNIYINECENPLISGWVLRGFVKDRSLTEKTATEREFLLRFGEIFSDQFKPLCRLAFYITGDHQTAKDVAQDVFTLLWSRRHKTEFSKSIIHYLRKATVHVSYNLMQQRRRRGELLTKVKPEWHNELICSNGERVAADELEQKVSQAINSLPRQCRLIFLLSKREEMSYKDIAVILGLSVRTVENQLAIALQKLRTSLAGLEAS